MQTLVAPKKTATFTRSGPASSRHRRIIAVGPPDMDGDVWELTLKAIVEFWDGKPMNLADYNIKIDLFWTSPDIPSNASFIFEQCCGAARPLKIFHTEVLE